MRIFLPIVVLLFLCHCKPDSPSAWKDSLEKRFHALAEKHSHEAQIRITSSKKNFLYISSKQGSPDQPFHGASIAKTLTAVILFQLIEEGKISLNSPIQPILGAEILQGLYISEGKDVSNQVLVHHLLEHTSGVADYFDSQDIEKSEFIKQIVSNPDRFFTPKDLLDEAKKQKKIHNLPGQGFFYSDTGYVLLGLLIEKITKKSYEENLSKRIFEKLGMLDSYVYLKSKPSRVSKFPLSKIDILGKDLSTSQGLSADWAGGGIVFTTIDLEIFLRALFSGKLISMDSLKQMEGENEFHSGIFYGKGLMKVDFSKMSIFMPKAPIFYGHSGVLGTLAFYAPDEDLVVVANFGNPDAIEGSFEYLFYSGFEGAGIKKDNQR